MPIVNIQIMQGRSEEKIRSLIARMTDMISEELDSPKDNIRVLVTEVPKTNWGIAGVTAADREKSR
jgi:4-oxalocrotonate tautomerase